MTPPTDPLANLPHGEEFRFVDRIESLVPGRSATASYLLRGDEHFLRGHFPGTPIMPGVLLVEALAQLGGVVAQCDPEHPPMDDLRLAAIRSAKITGAAAPGERLTITAEVTGRLGDLVQVAGSVASGGNALLRAQVTLSGTGTP